jgi:hypothetical protein
MSQGVLAFLAARLKPIRLKQGYVLKEVQERYHWVPLATFEMRNMSLLSKSVKRL